MRGVMMYVAGDVRVEDRPDPTIVGYGAHSVIEAVGTQESMMQAIRSTRPGGHVGVRRRRACVITHYRVNGGTGGLG